MDHFFGDGKTENNFKSERFSRKDIQIERETYCRMRKRQMIKYTVSTVSVQQLFVIYDEKAFQWDQCNAWYWHFFSFFHT